MRFATLIPILAAVSFTAVRGQNATDGADYVTGLVEALTAGGYATLLSLISGIATSPEGAAILAALPNSNKTLLAPTDGAWTGVSNNITGNATELAKVLSYHLLEGTYSTANIAEAPAHTIARSYLLEPGLGDRGQVLALSLNASGGIEIATPWLHWPVQSEFVTTRNSSTYRNIHVIGLDQVLNVPPTFGELIQPNPLTYANATSFLGAGSSIGMIEPIEALKSITVFLPTDAAFASLNDTEGGLVNASTILTILQNHIINSTTLYSTAIADSTSYLSLAGIPFTFSTSGNATTVSSGDWTANVVKADVPIVNGVVHYVDSVLLNTEANATLAGYGSALNPFANSTSPSNSSADPGVGPWAGNGTAGSGNTVTAPGSTTGAASAHAVSSTAFAALVAGALALAL